MQIFGMECFLCGVYIILLVFLGSLSNILMFLIKGIVFLVMLVYK